MSASSPDFASQVPSVVIESGAQKYVVLKVYQDKAKAEEEYRYILRGYTWAEDYGNIVEHAEAEVKQHNLQLECVGGSGLRHSPQDKRVIFIQSEVSEKYGEPDSSTVVELMEAVYPNYGISFMQPPRRR